MGKVKLEAVVSHPDVDLASDDVIEKIWKDAAEVTRSELDIVRRRTKHDVKSEPAVKSPIAASRS
jgi:hypothetical protein